MKQFFILLLLILVVYAWPRVPWPTGPAELRVSVLDIGQGDSIYLRLPDQEDVLIDTGADDRVLSQLGAQMPLGDREIELLILTHNHLDHIGGFLSLAKQYKINRIWLSGAIGDTVTYKKMREMIIEKKIPVTNVKAGDQLNLGETKLSILHPPSDAAGTLPKDQHAATIVTKIEFGSFCTLLTGDLNFQQEDESLAAATALHIAVDCPLLKVTHHGSSYGSSPSFLIAVKPKLAIISVGNHNLYHHPGAATLERLRQIGATLYRTDRNGTVTVTSDGTNYWTKTAR